MAIDRDRCRWFVRLTPAGKRLVDRAIVIQAANESRLLGPLDDDELRARCVPDVR